jgi:uncharacterized small protein (DUF1192 family)
MPIDPEELLPRKPKADIVIGEDLSAMSAFELEKRIAALEAEIARTRDALGKRVTTKSAAEKFFKQ